MFHSPFATPLGRLRLIAFLEGVSYLILLFIAMPLKYLSGIPEAVRVAGMAHGLLFVLFLGLLVHATFKFRWSLGKFVSSFVASLLPFALFYVDHRFYREEALKSEGDSGARN